MAYDDSYYDEMYPDKPYTYQDATVYDAGGACPFQASGKVGSNDFYFRVRHGSASLDVADGENTYERYTNVNTAEYDYLDGTCDMDTFEKLFDLMIADFRETKTPKYDVDDGQYNFTDVSNIDITSGQDFILAGEMVDVGVKVELTIEGDTASLKTDNGYFRQMNVLTESYDYLNGSVSDSGSLSENPELLARVFNALMADYID